MTTLIEAARQALEALETCMYPQQKQMQAITSLRQAIEQAEKQEPVALETVYETIIHWDEGGGKRSRRELARQIVALYTTPQPQREWVGLTDKEVAGILERGDVAESNENVGWYVLPYSFAQAIEAKLKEKNGL